jgi:prepilin-type N-terminal cleavage/methylation domain-containing protein
MGQVHRPTGDAAPSAASRPRSHSALCIQSYALPRSAFTLTEVIVVIGIIVILLALAVPAFSFLTGARSIEAAENTVSALLGRARASAIALGRPQGIMFFIDPTNPGRISVAEVYAGEYPVGGTRDVYLDFVPKREWLMLPPGIAAQVIDSSVLDDDGPAGTTPDPATPMDGDTTNDYRTDDGYIGYNDSSAQAGAMKYGGVVLFDPSGRLVHRSFGFLTGLGTRMTELVYPAGALGPFSDPQGFWVVEPAPPVAVAARTQFGLVLFDRPTFEDRFGDTAQVDSLAPGYDVGDDRSTDAIDEYAEERWLDANAVPLLVNRYNGTLVRGE